MKFLKISRFITCPYCENGKTFIFANRGEDYRKHTQEWVDCRHCDGSGIVTRKVIRNDRRGMKLKKLRVKKEITLAMASEITGKPITYISGLENGRHDNRFCRLWFLFKLWTYRNNGGPDEL